MEQLETRRAVARVEALLEQIEDDPVALEAVEAVVDLYGEALARVLAGAEPTEDELLRHLLLVHDLHPVDVETRVRQALDDVRPYLGSHGGDVELLGVEDGVARLRLAGTCNGCPSSTVTLKNAIEERCCAPRPTSSGSRPKAWRSRRPRRRSCSRSARSSARRSCRAREHRHLTAARARAAAVPALQADVEERCELCSETIGPEHRHLLDLEDRSLLCVCRPCSILFDHRGAGGGHYRLLPDRVRAVVDIELDDALWQSLDIPVDLAFFFHSSAAGPSSRSTRRRSARPSRCSTSPTGSGSSRRTRCSGSSSRTSRRCCSTGGRERATRGSSRSTVVTSSSGRSARAGGDSRRR